MDSFDRSTNAVERGFDGSVAAVIAWLPRLLGALLIVILGHMIANTLAKAVRNVLMRLQLDVRIHSSQGGSMIQRAVPSPTYLLERITYWLVFIGALSLAASVLGIDALNRFIAAIYGFVPNAIAALLIFLVGSAIAAGVTTLVRNMMGDTPTGKLLESIAPVIVMGITIFMILDQLNIAPVIVTITYAALVGSVALGSALAFGLGGRDVASRVLEATYQKSRENADQVKHDLKVGKEHAKNQVRHARDETA